MIRILKVNQRKIAVILLSAPVWLAGCSTPSLRQMTVTPTPGTEVLTSAGQTVQYNAIGSYQQGKHPPTTQNITSSVTWSSSNTSVATIDSTGIVTAVGSGTATITATGTGQNGLLSASSNVTVSLTSPAPARALSSMIVIPTNQTIGSIGETVQYLAIGTFNSAPLTQDLTSQVAWHSSVVSVARIDSTGLATGVSSGTTTITAVYTGAPPNSNTVTANAPLTLTPTTTGTVTLPTLAIYKVGPNAANGAVTGTYVLPGSPGTTVQEPNCAPNASIATCTASIPAGTTVTLTTTITQGFGGWSSNCTVVPGDPYTCTISLPTPNPTTGTIGNVTVSAIFD
jgi:hypothetical protein